MSILKNPYPYQLCTALQSREMDERTIKEFGIDGFTLMETAGLQAAREIAKLQANPAAGKTSETVEATPGSADSNIQKTSFDDPTPWGLFVCGKGNNGGDALVTARYLVLHHHHSCSILLMEGEGDLSQDSFKNLSLLKEMAENGAPVDFLEGPEMPGEKERGDVQRWSYIVDGMLGTGLTSAPRSPYDAAVHWINARSAPCYAMDIPTGLNSDNGTVMGEAVRATCTFSFGARKLGAYLDEGPDVSGRIVQLNLPFPDYLRETSATLVIPEIRNQLEPVTRQHATHKYSEGVVYILAGSDGLTGAAIMAALSAWKTGAGAVFLFSPRGLLDVYEKAVPEIIKIPVGKPGSTQFAPEDAAAIFESLGKHRGTLLAGPGVGRDEATLGLIRELLKSFEGNIVIDADAHYAINLKERPANASWIMTPHPGELTRVTGFDSGNSLDRLAHIKEFARRNGFTLISKGRPTMIGTAGGDGYITGYDTRIFSRAGFGDVLSGKVAGFLAMTDNPLLSSLHGLLDGYEKASVHLRSNPGEAIEPKDLL